MTIALLKEKMTSMKSADYDILGDEILNILQDQSELKELLTTILENEKELARIAKDSFYHNLGFIRINLIAWDLSICMLKIHIWNLDESLTNDVYQHIEGIHDHMYDFKSRILRGKLDCTFFSESLSENRYIKYENPLSFSQYIFKNLGEVYLNETLRITMVPGTSYEIKHDTIHSAVVDNKTFTSTICFQSDTRKKRTYLYSKESLDELYPQSRRFSITELKRIIEQYLKK